MTRRRLGRSLCAIVVVVVGSVAGAACGSAGSSTVSARVASAVPNGPLVAPRTSSAQEGKYLTDVVKSDSDLVTYVQQQGNAATEALLTDGAAFCAFLRRDRSIDDAMVDVAIGARSVEQQTQLPSTVKTFNAIDAVALLTLCPSEQSLIPVADRSRIETLGKELAG